MRARLCTVPYIVLSVVIVGACRSPKSEVEPGAALLHVRTVAGEPTPDSLLVWAYDRSGILWNRERVPKEGTLTAVAKNDLGTILIQPGQLQGALRVHMVGMQASTRVSGAVLSIGSLASGLRTFDVLLSAAVPLDTDGDGVPDDIDDCAVVPDPAQVHGQAPCEPVAVGDGGPEVKGPDSRADVRDADIVSSPDGLSDGDEATSDAADGATDASRFDDVGTGDGRQGDVPAVPDTVASDPRADDRPPPDVAIPPDAARDPVADEAPAPDGPLRCDAAGACGKAQGTQCAKGEECASGACVDGVCCANACAGACRSCNQPNAVGLCQGYTAGTDPEGECALGAACNGAGACGVPPRNLPNGQLCANAYQCASFFCKDGVCCESACNAPCQTCSTGFCVAVKRADDAPECKDPMTCNSTGKCVAR